MKGKFTIILLTVASLCLLVAGYSFINNIINNVNNVINKNNSSFFVGADVSRDNEPLNYLGGFKNAGVKLFGSEKLYWQDFEPTESSGYKWNDYDKAVENVEKIGGIISPTIWSVSSWATEAPSAEKPSSAPKKEYKSRYSGFIKSFMERYDKDGTRDMPGLKYAHNYLQIEDEAENLGDAFSASKDCNSHQYKSEAYYRCAANEYGKMLTLAYKAAHEANPNAQVISFSFNPGDYFDSNPKVSKKIANAKLAFLDEVFINYSDYFDIIGLQCNYSYTGIYAWFNYVKDIYKLDKPIICADAASMPMLGLSQFQEKDKFRNKYPNLSDDQILTILTQGKTNSKYNEIIGWWEEEKAKLSVKKAAIAAAAEAEQIFFQFIMTSKPNKNVWSHSDMVSGGSKYSDIEPIGTPRPVVHALGQFNDVIENSNSVIDLNPIPAGKNPLNWLWIIKFQKENKNFYIVWSDVETKADLSEYISSSKVLVVNFITKLDKNNNPEIQQEKTYPTNSVSIYDIPIFIEER